VNTESAELRIEAVDGCVAFSPLEKLELEITWQLLEHADAIEVRLVWYTEGKGDQDLSIVAIERFDHPPLHDHRRCSFTLPEGPYSFSGRLISVLWCAELVVLPKGPSRRLDLTVGPEGREVRLGNA
jgi:hypothetical protein